jgi:hypothetical protein
VGWGRAGHGWEGDDRKSGPGTPRAFFHSHARGGAEPALLIIAPRDPGREIESTAPWTPDALEIRSDRS